MVATHSETRRPAAARGCAASPATALAKPRCRAPCDAAARGERDLVADPVAAPCAGTPASACCRSWDVSNATVIRAWAPGRRALICSSSRSWSIRWASDRTPTRPGSPSIAATCSSRSRSSVTSACSTTGCTPGAARSYSSTELVMTLFQQGAPTVPWLPDGGLSITGSLPRGGAGLTGSGQIR